MLTDQGYHGTGIKQILDVAGVAKGSFYNFFPSKEAFVAAIITRYSEQTTEEFSLGIKNIKEEPVILQIWFGFYNKVKNKISQGESCACLFGAMSAEIAQASELCKTAIADAIKQLTADLVSQIRKAQQQGDLKDELSAETIAPLLYNCWQGSLLLYQVTDDPNLPLQQLKILLNTLATSQGQELLAKHPNTL